MGWRGYLWVGRAIYGAIYGFIYGLEGYLKNRTCSCSNILHLSENAFLSLNTKLELGVALGLGLGVGKGLGLGLRLG